MKRLGAAGMSKSVLLVVLTVWVGWGAIVREILRLFGSGR